MSTEISLQCLEGEYIENAESVGGMLRITYSSGRTQDIDVRSMVLSNMDTFSQLIQQQLSSMFGNAVAVNPSNPKSGDIITTLEQGYVNIGVKRQVIPPSTDAATQPGVDLGFPIANSVLFNGVDNKLEFTEANPVSVVQKLTLNHWLKRVEPTSIPLYTMSWDGSSSRTVLNMDSQGKFSITQYDVVNGSVVALWTIASANRLSDFTSWHNIHVIFDTTQPESSDRVRLYVDGVMWTVTGTFPNKDVGIHQNNGAYSSTTSKIRHTIGTADNLYTPFYLARFICVQGSANPPSYFGKQNSASYWVPSDYTNTYGSAGFNLQFTTSAAGRDSSPNGNNFTATGTFLQTVDTPTDNHPVWSPSRKDTAADLTYGNMRAVGGIADEYYPVHCQFGVFDGAYWEVELESLGGVLDHGIVGVVAGSFSGSVDNTNSRSWPGGLNGLEHIGLALGFTESADTAAVYQNGFGAKLNIAVPAIAQGAVIRFAYKLGKLWIGVNDTWLNNGDPTMGTGPVVTNIVNQIIPAVCPWKGQTFKILSGSVGLKKTIPSGFKKLSVASQS